MQLERIYRPTDENVADTAANRAEKWVEGTIWNALTISGPCQDSIGQIPVFPVVAAGSRILETDEGNENAGFRNAFKNGMKKIINSEWVHGQVFEEKDWVLEGLSVAQGTNCLPTSIIRTLMAVRVKCELKPDQLPSRHPI